MSCREKPVCQWFSLTAGDFELRSKSSGSTTEADLRDPSSDHGRCRMKWPYRTDIYYLACVEIIVLHQLPSGKRQTLISFLQAIVTIDGNAGLE